MSEMQNIPTPYYLYDLDLLRQTLQEATVAASQYDYHIHYAIKANHNPVITSLVHTMGLGIDCVSGNEVAEALHRGFSPQKIVYAGVGKSDEEILRALQNRILCLNCESLEELEIVAALAAEHGLVAPVALRVNPEVEAHTHKYITTGTAENKFGIPLLMLEKALHFCQDAKSLRFMGLHFHIGSQITALEPYENLCQRVNAIWKDFHIDKYNPQLVNMGGGLGIDYQQPHEHAIPDFEGFFATIARHLQLPSHINVHFELGRSLVGQCGSLITKVLYTKQGQEKTFVITDAGMTELLRPALYQAVHRIDNISSQSGSRLYDVVGPVCESSDVFGKSVLLPQTSRGDLLAIRSCGAYAESMMLRYNMRARARSFFVENKQLRILPTVDVFAKT